MDIHTFLAEVWYLILGLILVLYVITDGFDLGVGILTLFERDKARLGVMMAGAGAVRGANEIWLVLFGGALFGAFPAVYTVTLHALYVPLTVMLFGLILRGIALGFPGHAGDKRLRRLAFGGGSVIAALAQGYMLGALIAGLPVEEGVFIGGMWSWLGPFPSVVAVGVAAGYTLLGGTYLNIRTYGELQLISRRRSRQAAWIMLAAAACVTVATPLSYGYVAQRWFTMSPGFFLAMLPLAELAAWVRLLQALNRGKEYAPFVWSVVIFTVSFVGLAASLYPYLVPPAMSLAESASSSATLVFMLAGTGLLIPVMLVYNGFRYPVFRGKIVREIPAGSAKAADVARDAEHSANTTAGSVRQHAE